MRSRLVVVRQISRQDANQSGFVYDDHVIEALASDGADQPLCIGVLSRGTSGRAEVLGSHATSCRGERGKRVLAIVNEIARSRVFGKRLAELLRGPRGGRMRGDSDVSDAPTPVDPNDQHEQQSIGDSRHDEEIRRGATRGSMARSRTLAIAWAVRPFGGSCKRRDCRLYHSARHRGRRF